MSVLSGEGGWGGEERVSKPVREREREREMVGIRDRFSEKRIVPTLSLTALKQSIKTKCR